MVYTNPRNPQNQNLTTHEKSSLTIKAWHFDTQLLPDEALSSWIIRAGLRHGIEPLALGRIVWGDWRVWTRDIDRWLPNQRLEELSQTLKIPRDGLYSVSLTPWVRQMSLTPLNPYQRWYWVTSLSHRNRSRQSSFAYCPLCLSQDEIPYMRKSWRYSWVTTCSEHKIRLIESCPHCSFSINLSKHTLLHKSFRHCASCHSDLSSVTAQSQAETDHWNFQLKLTSALYAGLPVAHDFEAMKFLIKLIRQSLILSKQARQSALKDFINIEPHERSPLCAISFPELSIEDRHELIRAAVKLQALEERSFVDLLVESGITQSIFLKDKRIVPEKMVHIAKRLSTSQHACMSRRRASETWPAPRSHQATKRLIKVLSKSIRARTK